MDYFRLLEEQAGQQKNRAFLIRRGRELTYGQVHELAAGFLRPAWREMLESGPAGAGGAEAAPAKRSVLILSDDCVRQLVAFLGVMAAGHVPIIGHADLPEESVRELVRRNGIGAVLRDTGADGFVMEAGQARPLPYPAACMGVLSSGSTDIPKVMYRTYGSWADFFPEQNRQFRTERDSVVFLEGSFGFTGNLSVWAAALYAGATLVIGSGLNCRSWIRDMERYGATVLYLVPTKLKLLARYLERPLLSMRMVLAGSQLLGARTAEELRRFFPESDIILYYGASELNYITWLRYEEVLAYPESVGRPCPGVKVTVEDGMIWIDTPYHVEGLEQPCTLEDMGYFNEEGYLMFRGRRHNIINKGGFKINCAKVENAFCRLDNVLQAAVIPYEDEGRGQEAAAFLVLDGPCGKKEVRDAVKPFLMAAELPKRIVFVENLPLNSRGKVDAEKLRKILQKNA